MKILILCMAAVALCGCSNNGTASVEIEQPKPRHAQPAPGYGVACDGNGHYTFTLESPYTSKRFMADWMSFSNRQEAIEYGWVMYTMPDLSPKRLPYDYKEYPTNEMEAK